MKIMAIDYGDQHTGLAVSDPMGMIVGSAWIVDEWDMERLAETIVAEAGQREVEKLILGFPKNMDGSEGPRCEKVRLLEQRLKELSDLPVVLWDERRTTIEAHDVLRKNGKKEKKHKAYIDAVAASLILEGYLGSALN